MIIKPKSSKFNHIFQELFNYWKLGWLDNKARYAKTYLGEVWIALSVILLSSVLGTVYGDIFGTTIDGTIKYFSYLALGITLWNCIADAMAIGSRFILESANFILNTKYSLRSLYLRKFFYLAQNLLIGLSSILIVIFFVNPQLAPNYYKLFFPLLIFLLFILLILLVFSLVGCLIRDFAELVPLVTTLLFLSSPILYPASRLGDMAWIIDINIPYRILDFTRRTVLSGEINYSKCFLFFIIEITLVYILLNYLDSNRNKIALWCD